MTTVAEDLGGAPIRRHARNDGEGEGGGQNTPPSMANRVNVYMGTLLLMTTAVVSCPLLWLM